MRLMVTGTDGMLGSAIARKCKCFPVGRKYNLKDALTFMNLVYEQQPTHIIHCAASVGGWQRNADEPESLFHDNVVMNATVIHVAARLGVKHFIAFGSNCAFDPGMAEAKDSNIHEGMPYKNNRAYGYAKRMIDIHLQAAHDQYGMSGAYVIPPSMYGPNDNFGEDGHVIPSLIRKAMEAKTAGRNFIELQDDGSAIRNVAYVDDVADWVLRNAGALEYEASVILGGEDISVANMAMTVASVAGISAVKLNGCRLEQQQKRPSVESNDFPTKFREGIEKTVAWVQERWPNVRGMQW